MYGILLESVFSKEDIYKYVRVILHVVIRE